MQLRMTILKSEESYTLNPTRGYLTRRFDLAYLYCGLAYFLHSCETLGWSMRVLPESSRSDLYLVARVHVGSVAPVGGLYRPNHNSAQNYTTLQRVDIC